MGASASCWMDQCGLGMLFVDAHRVTKWTLLRREERKLTIKGGTITATTTAWPIVYRERFMRKWRPFFATQGVERHGPNMIPPAPLGAHAARQRGNKETCQARQKKNVRCQGRRAECFTLKPGINSTLVSAKACQSKRQSRHAQAKVAVCHGVEVLSPDILIFCS